MTAPPADTGIDTGAEQVRAHDLVKELRDELRLLDLPDELIREVVPQSDIVRRPYVRLGTWKLDHAEQLLTALRKARTARPRKDAR